MVNQILLNEIKKNEKGHKIFDYQKNEDLIELDEYIKIFTSDIIISLSSKEWYNPSIIIYSEEDRIEEIKSCRKYLVAKIIKELQKKYPKLEKYEIEHQLNIFEKKKKKEYHSRKEKMYDFEELIDIIQIEEIPIERIHFSLNISSVEVLCDALTIFLRDNLPFSVSIYLTHNSFYTILIPEEERTYLWQAYQYKRFKEQEEGKDSKTTKKLSKQIVGKDKR